MQDFFSDELKKVVLPEELNIAEMQFVGVGDVFKSLGIISRRGKKYPLDMPHNYVVSNKDVLDVFNAIKGLDVDKRSKIKGVSSASAGVLLGGLSIVSALVQKFDVQQIILSNSLVNF